MIQGIKHLLNAQVEVNRAVWAANLTNPQHKKHYIAICINEAIKDLQKFQAEFNVNQITCSKCGRDNCINNKECIGCKEKLKP